MQATTATCRLGGNGSGGTAALSYTPTTGDDLNISRSWVVSLDTDATASTLNLFIDGNLIGSVTGGPITDWSPEVAGAFRQGAAGVTPLREDFGNAGAAGIVGNTQIDSSELRFYEDTFVTVPEPSSSAMLMGGALLLITARRRSAASRGKNTATQ